ncbi:MAG: helix-turn-helix domain-containing protein [Verrucomicrobiota bacterium]
MLYRRQPPSPPLSAYVEYFWAFEKAEGRPTLEHVLPDGSFELVINLLEDGRKRFERDDEQRFQVLRRGWLSGVQSSYLIIDNVPVAEMIGAHFRPGGAAAFFGGSAADFRNQVIELDAIWGASCVALREQLIATKGTEAKFGVLESFLGRLLGRQRQAGSRSRRIAWAVEQFCHQPHVTGIARAADTLGISHKHFIDQFRDCVGLTPKVFCRIQRFQRVMGQIQAVRPVDWADVACACGYYDQAHFVHDFRSFTGLNPTAYLRLECPDSRFLNLGRR